MCRLGSEEVVDEIGDHVEVERAAAVGQVDEELDEVGRLVGAHEQRVAPVVVRVEVVLDGEVGRTDKAERLDGRWNGRWRRDDARAVVAAAAAVVAAATHTAERRD